MLARISRRLERAKPLECGAFRRFFFAVHWQALTRDVPSRSSEPRYVGSYRVLAFLLLKNAEAWGRKRNQPIAPKIMQCMRNASSECASTLIPM